MRNFPMPRERHRAARWATRLDPNYTLLFGCKELHSVFFASNEDFGGLRTVVVVQIPEDARTAFRHAAMELATQSRARVVFLCDTPGQARRAARKAAKMLPNHCRVSMERASRARGAACNEDDPRRRL